MTLKENLEQTKWILCSKRMPEEHEWIGTKEFGTTISDEVYVTFENPEGKRFVKHLRFQNGKLSGFDQSEINAFYKGSVPIAWMPLPEPYKAETEGGRMNTYIKPMTPTRRAEIDEGFENAINELRECEQNSLVQTQIGALLTYKRIIHNLPDGYPLPFEK